MHQLVGLDGQDGGDLTALVCRIHVDTVLVLSQVLLQRPGELEGGNHKVSQVQ